MIIRAFLCWKGRKWRMSQAGGKCLEAGRIDCIGARRMVGSNGF